MVTRNASGDETANVNVLYDDIVHVLQSTASPVPPQTAQHGVVTDCANTKISTVISQASKHNGKVKLRRQIKRK